MNDKLCNHTSTEGGKRMICTKPAGHSGYHIGKPIAELQPACYGEDIGPIPLPYPPPYNANGTCRCYIAPPGQAAETCSHCDAAMQDGKCTMGCDSPQPAGPVAEPQTVNLTINETLIIISMIERVLDLPTIRGTLLAGDCRNIRDTLRDKLRVF